MIEVIPFERSSPHGEIAQPLPLYKCHSEGLRDSAVKCREEKVMKWSLFTVLGAYTIALFRSCISYIISLFPDFIESMTIQVLELKHTSR